MRSGLLLARFWFRGLFTLTLIPQPLHHLITPFAPRGPTDAIARILADKMRTSLGQTVVVENVGGAGGSIAVGRVARAALDGYTIDIGQ